MSSVIELFNDGFENVFIEELLPDATVLIANERGLEMIVLAGSLSVGDRNLVPQGWIRLPAGEALRVVSGAEGAKIWVKDAPLIHADVCRLP